MEQPITILITIVTVGVSLLCFNNRDLFERLKHSPYAEAHAGEWYRLLTCGFVHGDFIHLAVNMFVFYQFGGIAEQFLTSDSYGFGPTLGPTLYAVFYLLTIVLANVPTLLKYKDEPRYGAIGASGAVSGTTFVFILFLPWEMIYLYGIIPIPGIVAGVLYLLYSQYASKRGGDNVDHSAHLAGALIMPALVVLCRPGIAVDFLDALTQVPF